MEILGGVTHWTTFMPEKSAIVGPFVKNVLILQTATNDLPRKAERGDLRWISEDNLLFAKGTDIREVPQCSTVHDAKTLKR